MKKALVRRSEALEKVEVKAGVATQMQTLVGQPDGAPNFAMRRFIMQESGGMPLHTNQVEHEQYVLKGRGRLVLGQEEREVGPGDVLFIPAGLPHSYEVLEAPFEFLCMVPNLPDRIEVVDPDKAPPEAS